MKMVKKSKPKCTYDKMDVTLLAFPFNNCENPGPEFILNIQIEHADRTQFAQYPISKTTFDALCDDGVLKRLNQPEDSLEDLIRGI
jgi:hypothetical protein